METKIFDELLKHKYEILLGVIVIVSLFVGIKYIGIDSVWPDEAFYAWNGYQLVREPFQITDEMLKTPLYVPFLLIGLLSIFVDKLIAAKLTVLLFSIVGIIATYYIGKMLKNELVGIIAAGFMAFNPIVMFLTGRALTDIPIAAMMALCILALFKYEQEKHWKWGLLLGLCVAGAFFTKMSGVILIPVLGLYFVLTRRTKIFGELKDKKFLSLLGVGIITFVPFFIFNMLKFGSLLPTKLSVYGTSYIFKGGQFYYITSMPQFVAWWLLPFLVIGLLFAVLNFKRPKQLALLLWFVIGLVIISGIGEKDLRYLGPIMPAIFLCIAYGISKFNINKKAEWIILGISAILAVSMFMGGIAHIESKANSYMGFKEAGEWLKMNVPEDSIIYAGSERAIRSFSDIQYEEYGGRLRAFPTNITTFEEEVANKSNVFAVVDVWEYTQPDWIYPLSNEKINALFNMSFNVTYFVQSTLGGQKTATVIVLGK
ncbi:MAG: glycosyltransferase family 39 protein [Candidatus Nanoarchaeia archaeon]|nr:glycosyltransferase family 39 protein [Candidatus Nanoarchaeia archaeon]MDD5239258.1 glycosyltransferase family 39 protein [Candidatus Nanoarchaeia archaeon]